jgi:hypothetical protein
MRGRSIAFCIGFIAADAVLSAQGLTPRPAAADYPMQAALPNGYTLAAEYLVHTLPTGLRTGALVANDYLVVEIAVFGPRGGRMDLSPSNFTLQMHGRKKGQDATLTPDSAGAVAASIKYSDWTQKPKVQASGGAGNATVGIGPTVNPRFPGDPSVRPLPPSTVPEENSAGLEKQQPVSIDEQVQHASLGSGELKTPAAGLIFFPFEGKAKSIKTLELIYEGAGGKVTLKLE